MHRLLVACLVALTMIASRVAAADGATVVLDPGRPLDALAAETLLADAIAVAAAAEGVRIEVQEPRLPLANPYAQRATLDVEDLTLVGDDRFAARVAIRIGSAAPLELNLAGAFVRLVAVAVPVRGLPIGTRIDDDDLELQLVPEHRVRNDWLVAPGLLVGKEVRRPLGAGRPVQETAIDAPRLVRRGEAVTLLYQRGGLRLETFGRAQADGAEGTLVEVRNEATGAVVRGRVVGPRRLRVEAAR